MKLTFLLGSGISRPAKLPSVEALTDAVLSGDGIVASKCVHGGPGHNGEREREIHDGRRRITFLDWLKSQASCRYAETPERSVNYEDLAYLAGQIADDIGDEYENPALQSFVRKAFVDLEGMFRDMTASAARTELGQLAESAVKYICRSVASQLRIKLREEDTRYLQFFANACRDKSVTEVNLFTLNHDTLLENFLRTDLHKDKFKVVDGLRCAHDGSRRWDHQVFDGREQARKNVNVFKLHGSINWAVWDAKYRPEKYPISSENTDRDACFIGQYTEAPRDGPRHGPLFLVGTFNKIMKYNSGLFLELHHRFHRALEDDECRTLIVCGYGFGDKGVNTRIVEWRRRSCENRLLIIDPVESSSVYGKARGAIQGEIQAIIDAQAKHCGPVKHLRKGIGKRSDEEIEVVDWEAIERRITGTDLEFVAD